jgi:hypothetical protein
MKPSLRPGELFPRGLGFEVTVGMNFVVSLPGFFGLGGIVADSNGFPFTVSTLGMIRGGLRQGMGDGLSLE